MQPTAIACSARPMYRKIVRSGSPRRQQLGLGLVPSPGPGRARCGRSGSLARPRRGVPPGPSSAGSPFRAASGPVPMLRGGMSGVRAAPATGRPRARDQLLGGRADRLQDRDLLRREVLAKEGLGLRLERRAVDVIDDLDRRCSLANPRASWSRTPRRTTGTSSTALSTAAVRAACCSGLIDVHVASLMTTRLEFSWWLDRLITSWTSWMLFAAMLLIGFSCPSTVPCWRAR